MHEVVRPASFDCHNCILDRAAASQASEGQAFGLFGGSDEEVSGELGIERADAEGLAVSSSGNRLP